MASPSVTYTFSNSTTADATQVNQNFTDLINGITDGTKDLSISALTCAGTATLNGNVNLGNATADDLVITASLNSSITNKTTFTNDLGGATSGMKSIYLASNDSASRSVRLIAGAVTASYTLTFPTAQGGAYTIPKNDGSGNLSWKSADSISSGSGAFSTTSAAYVDVTNLTLSYTASGSRVMAMLVPLPTGDNQSNISISRAGTSASGYLKLMRDSTAVASVNFRAFDSANAHMVLSPTEFSWTEKPSAGTYTYKIQAFTDSGASLDVNNVCLLVYEI